MAPRLMSCRSRPLARGALMGLCLLLMGASGAVACPQPPHLATQMPESVGSPWGLFSEDELVWYDGPTTRYPHGVLGDTIEATELHAYSDAALTPCGTQSFTLPAELVFEDIAPRLVDLSGDGLPEIVVVQSHQRLGAQLAVYRFSPDGVSLTQIAATPFIGRTNRWLAPIGAFDLDGDGLVEVAYIDRPHLARTLRVWRFVPGQAGAPDRLEEVASLEGLTNHRIGEDFISGGLRDCGSGPEMITANADWSRVMATRFDGDGLQSRALGAFSPAALAAAMTCAL